MQTTLIYAVVFAFLGCLFIVRADLRRRKQRFFPLTCSSLLTMLDVTCVSASAGASIFLIVLSPRLLRDANDSLTPATFYILGLLCIAPFLWSEGTRQVQLQRPAGIVFGEWSILMGVILGVSILFFRFSQALPAGITLSALIAGGSVLAAVLPPFLHHHEEHRILDRIATAGEFVQHEYAVATPECKHPERWRMFDAQSAELEVLEFLKALVMTEKPDLVLETGTFIGHSAIKMAEGMCSNGFGKIITVEYDPRVFAKAKQNIEASGLAQWIECRNCSSLETVVNGGIDILYSDSDIHIREQEIRRFLPRIKPGGLVLIHDASSSVGVIRDAALRLEQEELLSVVLINTPRGLVVAQKREGRK